MVGWAGDVTVWAEWEELEVDSWQGLGCRPSVPRGLSGVRVQARMLMLHTVSAPRSFQLPGLSSHNCLVPAYFERTPGK